MQGLAKIMLAMAHAAIDEGLTLHQLTGLRRRLEATLAGEVIMLGVRPSVAWFAEQMEAKLREGDAKHPAWDKQEIDEVLAHLERELAELRAALAGGEPAEVINEAADVANVALIIADRANGCPFGGRGKGQAKGAVRRV